MTRLFGQVPGSPVGSTYGSGREVREAGLHPHLMNGSMVVPPSIIRRRLPSGCWPNMLSDSPAARIAAAKWAERNSPLLIVLNERAVARRVLDSLTVLMDGRPAAANTVARRRASLHNALEYAVELDRLQSNPLARLRWKAPKVGELVDVRTVVNHNQARALFAAVGQQSGSGPALVAFFGSTYYAAIRPAEAAELRESDIVWPAGNGSGELGSTRRIRPRRSPGRTTAAANRPAEAPRPK